MNLFKNTLHHSSLIFAFALVFSSCSVFKSGRYVLWDQGKSLEALASENQTTAELIQGENPSSQLRPGKWIFIPKKAGVLGQNNTVMQRSLSSGEQIEKVAPVVSTQKTIKAPSKEPKELFFIWPVPSITRISSKFGPRHGKFHEGIDIPASIGTHIVASAPGEVVYANKKISGYGKMVVVAHDGEYFSVYAHANKMLVKKGDKVQRGQVIAHVGRTGRATGPHLHYEIRQGKTAINPLSFVEQPIQKQVAGLTH